MSDLEIIDANIESDQPSEMYHQDSDNDGFGDGMLDYDHQYEPFHTDVSGIDHEQSFTSFEQVDLNTSSRSWELCSPPEGVGVHADNSSALPWLSYANEHIRSLDAVTSTAFRIPAFEHPDSWTLLNGVPETGQ